ncbi:tetraspanin 37 isoform X2 [Cynoglossus semilaevis]|nr:tetraspanin-3-like isoform X2 [Cynoglossus semilaevis]
MPAVLTLASTAVLLVCGLLGSWLSVKESTFLQGLFVFLLVVVFCLQSSASALAYYHSGKLDSEMTFLAEVFHNYTGSSLDDISRAVDATQENLRCCGITGYRDWRETLWFNQTGGHFVPHSCCNSSFQFCNGSIDNPWYLYSQGCQVALESAFQFVLSFIYWGGLIVFLSEVLVYLTVVQLMEDNANIEYHILSKHRTHFCVVR